MRVTAGLGGRFAVQVHGKRPRVRPSLNVDYTCYFYFSRVFLFKVKYILALKPSQDF